MSRRFPSAVFTRKRAALIMLVILIAIPVIGFLYLKNQWIVQPLEIGEQIPIAKVQTLEGKEVLTCSVLTRKSVLIFFSTDCSHCQKEMNDLRLFYPIVKDSLSITAISSSEMQETKDFIVSQYIPFSVYLDNNNEAKKRFRVRLIPAMFFVDEKQRIMQYKAGEQKREQLWSMLKRFAGFIKDSSLAQL
jgi:peroxiredoxin